jgi:hypothetical protein
MVVGSAAAAVIGGAACTPRPAGLPEREVGLEEVALGLEALSPGEANKHAAHFRELLADSVQKDRYECLPPVDLTLGPPRGDIAERRIEGEIPHYNLFFGPFRYRVRGDRAAEVWRVSLNVALDPSTLEGVLELPDCALKGELRGEVVCEGIPHEEDPGVKACPESGRFEAPVSRRNLEALVRRWSEEVEAYWNRDAERYGLAVRYDFEFFLATGTAKEPVDIRTALWMTCGRTPYFTAFRSGWSIPIVAHEVGHYLGLFDEYEALSGMLYEKTPFEGSENSRMGLSMKTYTRLYPLHHYLVLRRFHCDEPSEHDPYQRVLDPSTP